MANNSNYQSKKPTTVSKIQRAYNQGKIDAASGNIKQHNPLVSEVQKAYSQGIKSYKPTAQPAKELKKVYDYSKSKPLPKKK